MRHPLGSLQWFGDGMQLGVEVEMVCPYLIVLPLVSKQAVFEPAEKGARPNHFRRTLAFSIAAVETAYAVSVTHVL